jgi:hypothetical protein
MEQSKLNNTKAKERAVAKWFCISCLMLLVPLAEFGWVFSHDLWRSLTLWQLAAPWLGSDFVGLLCAVRSSHLARKSARHLGTLAAFLHIGSLLLFGMALLDIYNPD